ncbi:hypothetical protein SPRG_03158 [Saprolegnia parasitica CBS 223.65]|uniref:GH18 domain-containing protein n=1 Tax=Saprolegnia parasitica (strain CBS 223.65) TaxID=695850 RepID=A0A067CYQ8_SAPPC|nr:hypothetical protein SPRG_03158 [Saprolegnia parasitica CBS 223.65]KDO31942.1 hypothetical protein SPRG_03158 [Saprolegnia parasitica CBS 223.65]|eukprot:XP_012197140.1 hypothetical protein SPRG_03158 [Saprolegnia parasitica CBS 223.65]
MVVALLTASPHDNAVCHILATPDDRRAVPHPRICKALWPLLSLAFLISVVSGIVYAVQSNASSHESALATKERIAVSPTSCRAPLPSQRVVLFWETQVEGCMTVPPGVTHIVFGFALVQQSRVVPTFQGADATLRACIAALQARCIIVMASIGGATNVDGMASIDAPDAFAASALALVESFGLDGVDIDDETVGATHDAKRVTAYMTALHRALKGGRTPYYISYDVFVYEGVASVCTNATYSRCFAPTLLPLLDWVNIMAYNVDIDRTAAAAIYANATTTIFPEWFASHLGGDVAKATIGVCVGGGCAYGDGPSDRVIANWAEYAKSHGGMMVYAGSSDVNFAATKSIITALAP